MSNSSELHNGNFVGAIKLPFAVLSYGQFALSKKLFSCELGGINTLPIFINLELAQTYATRMSKLLADKLNDERILMPQICADPAKAISMLATIRALTSNQVQIIVDPTPPNPRPIEIKVMENIITIDDAIVAIKRLCHR